jgi:hypothetical protein
MSRVGSPSIATRSAHSPGFTMPMRSSIRRTFAVTDVAVRIASSGVMP